MRKRRNSAITGQPMFFFFFLQSESSVDMGVGSAFRRIEKKNEIHVYHRQSLHRSPGVASATVEMTTPALGWRQGGMAKQRILLEKGVPPKILFPTLLANLSIYKKKKKNSTGNSKQR